LARATSAGDELNVLDDKDVLRLDPMTQTDFHIALAYHSRAFQTVAGYEEILNWRTFDHPAPFTNVKTLTLKDIYLDEDILRSTKSFNRIKDNKHLIAKSWAEISVAFNHVTGHVFPTLYLLVTRGFVICDESVSVSSSMRRNF
jgi:hypothetical protein